MIIFFTVRLHAHCKNLDHTVNCTSMLSARVRFMYDTRSFADVVKEVSSAPLDTALTLRGMLDAVQAYEHQYFFCPRLANFHKVFVLITFGQLHKRLRFFRTVEWRNLYYTCRNRVAFFWYNRAKLTASPCQCEKGVRPPPNMNMMKRCSERTDDLEKVEELGTLFHGMRGPHCLHLFVFMHLSQRAQLGNDLALYIFDFL